ncbi:MAG: SGNH/GDSL hydrolase family protein [Kiritimatiellae bacterium]|nr:SGNH/GDSL hydrolase family protein [Kiritimatiellia bacterium]MDW8458018.1 SGNH/GDSL hydrolase family protein [Verrucomicrobiota bacterium]
MNMMKQLRIAVLLGFASFLVAGCLDGGGDSKYDDHDFGDNDRNKVVALGDSITQGYTCEDETKSYPDRIAEMTGLTVINAGVSAERSGAAAARAGRVLDRHKPGFLLILTGHNDAIFDVSADAVINNIRSIINAALARKTVPIVATLVPIGAPRRFATGPAREYSARIRELAKEMNVELVDLEMEFGDRARELQCDGLHPNDAGSAVIAAAFADKLP